MTDLRNPTLEADELLKFSVLALAHVGDGVYELLARTHLALSGRLTAKDMHRETIRLVCAHAQAEAYEKIRNFLTEEEHAVFIRGRNAKPKMIPKHADRAEYARATGMEALFGWLFLSGHSDRTDELFQAIIKEDLD